MNGTFTFVPSADELAAIFAHAAAPAFLLAGVGGFVSVLLSRLNMIVDRLRHLSEIDAEDPARASQRTAIPVLKRRGVLLHQAAYLTLTAGISTTLLLVLSVAAAFFRWNHFFGGVALFGVATALLTAALFRFAQEVKLAQHEMEGY